MAEYKTEYTPLVEELESDISAVSIGAIQPLPDLSNRMRHDGYYTYIEDMEPGLYVDPQQLDGIRSTHVSFTVRPGRRLTHENSRHKVYFGDITYGNSAVPVAVKTMPEFDMGELAIAQVFEQEGIPTFKPFGYLISPEEQKDEQRGRVRRGHLLTRYQSGIEPVASIDWRELSENEKWEYAGYAADLMAMLHPHMFFHTDLHFRNVTIDRMGDVIVPDLEHTVSLRAGANELLSRPGGGNSVALEENIEAKLSAEFATVTESVEEFVFGTLKPRVKDPAAKFRLIRAKLLDRYEEQIAGSSSDYASLLQTAYTKVLSRKKEDARKGKL